MGLCLATSCGICRRAQEEVRSPGEKAVQLSHNLHRFLQRLILVAIQIRDNLLFGLPVVGGDAAVAAAIAAGAGAGASTGTGTDNSTVAGADDADFPMILGIGCVHCIPDGTG